MVLIFTMEPAANAQTALKLTLTASCAITMTPPK
jgi:hypothetical protein